MIRRDTDDEHGFPAEEPRVFEKRRAIWTESAESRRRRTRDGAILFAEEVLRSSRESRGAA